MQVGLWLEYEQTVNRLVIKKFGGKTCAAVVLTTY